MFTGIVEEVGRVTAVELRAASSFIRVAADAVLKGLESGDSVALDGVCQTVVATGADGFAVEAIETTLGRTTLGSFRAGRRVNLERALAAGGRIGGHFVQGHVDGVGAVARLEETGEHVLLDLDVPGVVAAVTVLHGSIAVNGVSLTVNALPAPGRIQVAIIPYTWRHTNFADLREGDPVNLEGDMIGRFVIHYLERTAAGRAPAADRNREA